MDSCAIASNIKHHAEFKPLFAPEHFSPLNAYHATAKSVFDALLINWNATYNYYNKMNVKQAYYLSMEFLQVPQPSSYLIICLLLTAS
jgi:starch phosphorylase